MKTPEDPAINLAGAPHEAGGLVLPERPGRSCRTCEWNFNPKNSLVSYMNGSKCREIYQTHGFYGKHFDSVGGFTNPFEKYMRKSNWESFPQSSG